MATETAVEPKETLESGIDEKTGTGRQEEPAKGNDDALLDALEKAERGEADGETPPDTSNAATEGDFFEVPLDGGTFERVKKDDLIGAYKERKGLTQRLGEAEKDRAAWSEATKAYNERLSQYGSYLNDLIPRLQARAALSEPDWKSLEDSGDTVALLRAQREWQEQTSLVSQALSDAQALRAEQEQVWQAQARDAQRRVFAEQGQKLMELVPEWKDASKRTEAMKEITGFLQDSGVSNEDINGLAMSPYAATQMSIVWDAMKYRKLLAGMAQRKKGAETAPPFLGRGAGKPAGGARETVSQAVKRHSEKGSVESFARLDESLSG